MPLSKQPIHQDWHFKQTTNLNNSTASSFLPVSQFPTVAHLDLLHHKLIPDPYIDCNELKCLWVNDADWTYRTESLPPINLSSNNTRAVLVFDGLDTIVDVYLNDKKILSINNMHISHRVDVTDIIRDLKGEKAVLELRFQNAPAHGRKEMERIGYRGNGTDVHFGGPERLFVRKAQYHWGWDWGPALNTCGPWKDIWLETYEKRIDEFIVRQSVAEDLKSAKVIITGSVEGGSADEKVVLEITDPEGKTVQIQDTNADKKGIFKAEITVDNPQLWYPFTYGSQPLYTITANVAAPYHQISQTLGLRRLTLSQHALKSAPGTSFLFVINNIPIFCGGSCWIPGDCLLPRMTPQRYEDWLLLAKAGNQVMIRVWGGGIVESDDFYAICDREGILVWQDFLFACGNYPASDDFVANVKHEAEQQMKRVGYHASLVLWAGNNEDYMLAERWGWEYDGDDQEGPWDGTDFPARKIYERTLPEVHSRLGGDVPYWRSSPYGGKTSNDLTIGDTHIWNVWHGQMSPYQDYAHYTSRFISEFGFESSPSLSTLHQAITPASERHWQSATFDAHDKGPSHARRYGMYAGENFRFRFNPLKDFVYCTQFLQAEAMKYAYNHWRREFRGPGEENCAGILVWQLNDIWPGVSWALVDVNLQRKMSYYITKRALAKVVVGMERVVTGRKPYIVTSYGEEKRKVEIWGVSGHLEQLTARLELKAFDIVSGQEVELPAEERRRKVTLKPNQTTELLTLDIPAAETTVVAAYLVDEKSGAQLARWVSWPEPLKYVIFKEDVKVEVEVHGNSDGEQSVVLKADAPVKGVVVAAKDKDGEGKWDADWSDNFVDLVPGEAVRVSVKGLNGRSVETRWLCDWEAEEGFEL